jgi:micrococcal nuclease
MIIIKLTLLAFLITYSLISAANPITGKVVNVNDGDTVTLLLGNSTTIKVRLSEIDAPEKNQPWGQKSKEALTSLVATKIVSVHVNGKDRYGRTLGTLLIGNENINKLMVKRGNAWPYTKYVVDQEYFDLQAYAKTKKIGLWALNPDQIIPPWEWRQKKR